MLELGTVGRDTEVSAFLEIASLADPGAAASQLHRVWKNLLVEERGNVLSASKSRLGRWDNGDEEAGE